MESIRNIWPEWEVEKQLGRGSYGTVYKAVRRDSNVESFAAIKVINIPYDEAEVNSLRSEGLDENGTRTYFKGIVDDFVSEIQLMQSLKGMQNIVSVEDYKVVEKTDTIGWGIYIRMELLKPFSEYLATNKMTEDDVIKLGIDICSALEICSKKQIIHRDIKPENIFINDFGFYKLGDFGIARKLENSTGGMSQKGTFNYMAPEVVQSSKYDARVDIYSLGIVLYRLLNGNKLPFIETEQQLLNPNERKRAVDRRLAGELMNPPAEASPNMQNLILRACAHQPQSRFQTATEMKKALISIQNGTYVPVVDDLDSTVRVRHTQQGGVTPEVPNPETAAGGFTAFQPVVPTPPAAPDVYNQSMGSSGSIDPSVSIPPVWSPVPKGEGCTSPDGYHSYKVTNRVAATCTTEGMVEKTCEHCGHKTVQTVPAQGHQYGTEPQVVQQPTCTQEGMVKYTCTRCGHEELQALPKAEHSFGPWYYTPEGGQYRICEHCGMADDGKTPLGGAPKGRKKGFLIAGWILAGLGTACLLAYIGTQDSGDLGGAIVTGGLGGLFLALHYKKR